MKISFPDIKYGDHLVLCAGNLDIIRGNLIAVTGESGSGKTSMFRYIIDDHFCFSDGKSGMPNVSISSCFQEPCFIDHLLIIDHFEMETKGICEEKWFKKYVELLELEEVLGKYPLQLSGGEQKRVAFLLCVCRNRDLYMFDEPTASVNMEYTERYAEILEDLKGKGKYVLLFTHDPELVKRADVHNEIRGKKLELIGKPNAEEAGEDESDESHRIDIKRIPEYMMKEYQSPKRHIKIIRILLTVCMAFVALFYNYKDVVYQAQQGIVKKMQSDELIVFKYQLKDYYDVLWYKYDQANYPLADEDIAEMKKINHVDDVRWRIDFSPLPTNWNNDPEEENFDEEGKFHYTLDVYEGDQFLGQSELENGAVYATYFKDHKHEKQIQLDFGIDGVYISRCIANIIEANLKLYDEDLKGKSLKFMANVPVYNTDGRWFNVNQVKEITYPITSTTIIREEVTLPIAGILEWSSYGLPCDYAEALYIERDILEEKINKNRRTTSRTLYVMDDNITEFYVDKLPDNISTEEVPYIYYDKPWKPTAVSVFVDGVENIPGVVKNLENLGYSVISDYTNQAVLLAGVRSVQDNFVYGALALGLIVIIGNFGISLGRRKNEEKINEYLSRLGLNREDILDIRKKFYKNLTIRDLKKMAFIMVLCYLFITLISRTVILPIKSILIVSALVVICDYWLNVFLDRYRKC